jgi:hypothetical protein
MLLQVSFLENHNLDPLQSLISYNNHIFVVSVWGMKKKQHLHCFASFCLVSFKNLTRFPKVVYRKAFLPSNTLGFRDHLFESALSQDENLLSNMKSTLEASSLQSKEYVFLISDICYLFQDRINKAF